MHLEGIFATHGKTFFERQAGFTCLILWKNAGVVRKWEISLRLILFYKRSSGNIWGGGIKENCFNKMLNVMILRLILKKRLLTTLSKH